MLSATTINLRVTPLPKHQILELAKSRGYNLILQVLQLFCSTALLLKMLENRLENSGVGTIWEFTKFHALFKMTN